MSNSKRERDFFIRSYLPFEELTAILQDKRSTINRYALIKHDKDDCEVHTHIFLRFIDRKSLNVVKELFPPIDNNGVKQSTFIEFCKSETIAVRYLMHLDDPNKFQYDSTEVVYFNLDLQSYIDISLVQEDFLTTALFEMLDGVPLRELSKRYKRDFIIHYRQLKELAKDIEFQERCYTKKALIDLETGEFCSPTAHKEYDFKIMKDFIRSEIK